MNMHHSFAPERAIAEHCPELTERGPRAEDRAEFLSMWLRDAAAHLENDLMPLFMGERLQATLGEPEKMLGSEVFGRIGPVAVNCLLRCGEGDETVLLSLDLANALALTDRSFGGDGAIPAEAEAPLPNSAAILIDRLALVVARALARASNADTAEASGDVIVRSESAIRLKPFETISECVVLPLSFGPKGGKPWSMLVAMREDQLDSMLPGLGAEAIKNSGPRGPADPRSTPFANIPMPLDAILAEFELSLDGLKSLAPGDEIPLTMRREIPLRVDELSFARGTVGTLDDHMAIRLTGLTQEGLSI